MTEAATSSGASQPSWLQRVLLPGLAFKAVVIGGGYATGRELAEYFIPSGPWGGIAGMALAIVLQRAPRSLRRSVRVGLLRLCHRRAGGIWCGGRLSRARGVRVAAALWDLVPHGRDRSGYHVRQHLCRA